jgi:hypothetical protein
LVQKGTLIGIGIALVAAAVIFAYTNIFELAKPTVEQSVGTAKETISKVEGKDVVKGAEIVSERILNETSKIEIKNPLP